MTVRKDDPFYIDLSALDLNIPTLDFDAPLALPAVDLSCLDMDLTMPDMDRLLSNARNV